MRVRVQFGSRVGEVVDFPPREAAAMLADGRAVAVDDAPPADTAGDRMADAVVRDPVSRPDRRRRR